MKWILKVFSVVFVHMMSIFNTGGLERKLAPRSPKDKTKKVGLSIKKKYKVTRFPIEPRNNKANNSRKRFTYRSQAYEYSKKRVAKAQGRPFARFRSR